MNTVWIYVDTSKEVGDVDHLKVFADADAADRPCRHAAGTNKQRRAKTVSLRKQRTCGNKPRNSPSRRASVRKAGTLSTGYNLVPGNRTAFIYTLLGLLKSETSASSGIYQTVNLSGYGPTFGGGYDIGIYDGTLNNGYAFPYSYGPGCVSDCEANGNILGLSALADTPDVG
jgi:hypothetical protein